MGDKIVIDTNLFMDDANIIFKLSKQYEKIVVPVTVLTELDKHKYDPDLAYSARNALYSILQFESEYPDKLIYIGDEESLSKNDRMIVKSAKEVLSDLATKDVAMHIVARAKGIQTKLHDVVMNGIFHPYKEVDVNDLVDYGFKQEFKDGEYQRMFDDIAELCEDDLVQDAWFFVFMKHEENVSYIYAHNPLKHVFERIDNKPKYREINIFQHSTLKALDEYQVCAMYALNEAPNVVLTGKWGSGKTLIGTAYSLSKLDNRKVFITRPPIGINHKYDIGYMPGDKDEKMLGWFAGFLSALYYLYANTRGQINYDHIKDHIFREKFETIPINAIQGMSLLEGDIFIADEVQLIDIDYLSMILSRASKGSKLILLGDLCQTYGVVRPSESGLLKLLRSLPHRSIAYVELKNSHRGELLEVANKLQDKTIY